MSNPFFSAREKTSFYPIIFVRGFAMRDADIEQAVSEPFGGFENGSTMLRQGAADKLVPFYFESTVIRLITEYGYEDVYQNGREPQKPDDFDNIKDPTRAMWVYRYYEQSSETFGDGKREEIEDLAEGLHDLVENLRELYGALGDAQGINYRDHFKVFLVAHSMGGLVVRSYLQKVWPKKAGTNFDPDNTRVDKVFTYATPHNGIELQTIGNRINVGLYDINNFYRPNMAEYLGLRSNRRDKNVNDLNGKFPAERLFSLVGTNAGDYDIPLSAALVGTMSDGLVRISNAYTKGSPRAHVHRAHGGPVGIVNSEDGYQNLQRFLFGDTRIDGSLVVTDMTLPTKIEQARNDGRDIEANIYFDTVVSVRGGRGWNLTRRKFAENSACRRQLKRFYADNGDFTTRSVSLFSSFLRRQLLINKRLTYMAFAIDLSVFADRFEVDRKWWLDDHFDGISFLNEKLFVEVALPEPGTPWQLKYRVGSSQRTAKHISAKEGDEGRAEFRIPVNNTGRPGLRAELVLTTSPWS